MMSKRFIPVALLLIAASFFIAFQSQGRNEGDENPKARYAKILRNVGILLEEGHYSPKKIDDAFSKSVFKTFLEQLDGDKSVLLQADINSFKPYETVVDDEIHGADIQSFFAVNTVYQKRLDEVSQIYTEVLARPMDFTTNETVEMDPEKRNFPASEKERYEYLRKSVKYAVLDRYVSMQEDQVKSKDKKEFVAKADSTLEREARDMVSRQLSRYMTTRKNRETSDENFSTFVNAITTTMDPHTTYFPPVDLRTFNESMRGSFYGIGAQLMEEDGKIKITSLISGGPAWKGGELKEKDEIMKVGEGAAEPVDVTGYALQDAIKLIRGSKKGTEVRLTVRKVDGTIQVISIIRDDVKLEDVYVKSAVINGEHKIGYIYLPEFYANFDDPSQPRCADDVAREIEKLKAENVEGIVMDLRDNGGGSLYDVVQMAGLFIGEGPICQVKARGDKAKVLDDRDNAVKYSGPLAVLVNETSASASEIFAAAIQDYKRGIIIGSTSTYGKGTVQRNIPLNPQSQSSIFSNPQADDLGTVKLTLQKFYRINGGATQLEGVVPDIVLPDRLEYLKFREKDNPNALKWDKIPQASYKPWVSTYSSQDIISKAQASVSNNPAFTAIRQSAEWLEKNADRKYSLNIDQFKADQKKKKEIYQQMEAAYKLQKPININYVKGEEGTSADPNDRSKQWLKARSEDLYIDKTVQVVSNMITEENLAKRN